MRALRTKAMQPRVSRRTLARPRNPARPALHLALRTLTARPACILSGFPLAPATARICTGCHRGVCLSCGQDLVTQAPATTLGTGHGAAAWRPVAGRLMGHGSGGGGGRGGAAAAAARMQQQQQQEGFGRGEGGGGGAYGGMHARAPGVPEVRSWVQRGSTLRRVSMGMGQDQVWVDERGSLDRRGLDRVSGMVQGCG